MLCYGILTEKSVSGAVWEYRATDMCTNSHIGSMPQLGARCRRQLICVPRDCQVNQTRSKEGRNVRDSWHVEIQKDRVAHCS